MAESQNRFAGREEESDALERRWEALEGMGFENIAIGYCGRENLEHFLEGQDRNLNLVNARLGVTATQRIEGTPCLVIPLDRDVNKVQDELAEALSRLAAG